MSDIIPLKHCPKCGNDFPPTLEYFHTDKSKKSGLTCYCQDCQAHHKTPRKNPSDLKRHRNTSPEYKWCPGCKQDKAPNLDNFHATRATKDGLTSHCKECGNVRSNKWSSEHKEEIRLYRQQHSKEKTKLYMQQYHIEHRAEHRVYALNRRSRKKAIPGIHTPQQLRDQYGRQKGKCYYCSKKVKWGEHHVDHTFPLSRVAGTGIPANSIDYLVVTCKHCNLSKSDRFPWEWPEGNRLL